ncbi:MAG: hypothetical protein WB608_18360, partial [Terracidiphilus sp.]
MALAPFKEQVYGIDSEIRFCSISLSFRKEGCIRSLFWSVPMKSLFLSAVQSAISFFAISAGFVSAYGQAPITPSVDLRDAPRKLLHATEIIPVRPGAMTLAYPKWIGNEHELGPIGQQAGLFITAHRDGRPTAMRMRRDR